MPSQWVWSFSAIWRSETPEPIHLKSGMSDYVKVRKHMQNMVAVENGGWVGHMGEDASVHPQHTIRSVDFRSVHPKTCFGGGCVTLGSICRGGQIFPFFAPKPFFNGPNKAIILHGSE